MSLIKVLPENIYNKIAAGEVIERPASVVKELVENALDAGAGKITVSIENAGTKTIAVSDDGNGMDQDDAFLCLEPHATSKIHSEEDITQIVSFGFRGEAIPSIASISRFTVRTRKQGTMEGFELVVNGGKIVHSSPIGCAPGTEMIIRDLFFNTPARKKFLKTRITEEKHIQETLFMLSLPYPGVAFELIMDGRRIFSSPAHQDLIPRLQAFLGKQTTDNLMPVAYSSEAIKVNGFIAKHGFTRTSRREQRIFVNGRPVEALPVYRGISEGYGSLIEKGRFPPTVLFLKMNPDMVDVNVHPAKREVRFHHEYKIISAIADAIKIALRSDTAPTVAVESSLPLKSILDGASVSYHRKATAPSLNFQSLPNRQTIPPAVNTESAGGTVKMKTEFRDATLFQADDALPEKDEIEQVIPPEPQIKTGIEADNEPEEKTVFAEADIKILGIIDNTYILTSSGSELLIIDQHAAHERVMYEKLLKKHQQPVPSQKLLIPITIELSGPETMFIEKYGEMFEELGFELESFGHNTVLVNTIPSVMKQENVEGLIHDLLSELFDNGKLQKKPDLNLIAMAACKAAVKAHDKLTPEEARSLMKQMSLCELPFSCPHGRPTIINITLKELEKRFGRK
jgi:DNA mismatch repair protein MutL